MINTTQFELSQQANEAISKTLKQRIPFCSEFKVDSNPKFVSMADYFANTDSTLTIGERIYRNQNKSRSDRDDICIECRVSRSQFINPQTNDAIPLGGAYWYETGKCWLFPRWGEIDLFSVYLPSASNFVGIFCRYYLDIMFSKRETWEAMNGICRDKYDKNIYIVFFNYKTFCNLYMQTVSKVTLGDSLNVLSNNEANEKEEK